MHAVWPTTLVSVGIVSLISLIGAFILSRNDRDNNPMKFLIALAIGALLGDVVIHLLPEAYADLGLSTAWWLLGGFAIFFVLEKILHWRHEHVAKDEGKIEPFGIMNLFGDALHNLIDGMLIAASYLVAFPIGLATTIAVVLHEIPQELGDYAILRSAGFTKARALGWNFISALFAVVGAISVLSLRFDVDTSSQKILAFTAGGFLYMIILLMDQLGKEVPFVRALGQLVGVGVGILLMWLVTFVE